MSSRHPGGPHELPDSVRAERLRMLDAMGRDDSDILLSALQHATAELDGLGGMAHLNAQGTIGAMRLVTSSGLPQAITRNWESVPVAGSTAPAYAWRDGGFVWFPGVDVSADRASAGSGGTGLAMAAVPLPSPGGAMGALSLLTLPANEPDHARQAFFLEVGRWAADRLRRTKEPPMADTQPTADRTALVRQLTRALAEAITVEDVVTGVAASVLPAFHATGLLIAALDDDRLYLVGAVGYAGEFLDRLSGKPFPADSPIADALRARTPLFFASRAELDALYPQPRYFPIAREKEGRAVLPLVTSGRPIGVGVVSYDRRHHFTGEERVLLTALSGLIAQALERARLYDDAVTRARELQRGLLPRDLPSAPAVTAAARYLPAEHSAQVGGDWYDVIRLSAERVALVIGDVMGHGIGEAATMGRLRTAVQTLSDLELAPDDILGHLNGLVAALGPDYYATCLYGVYDPVTGDFTHASAGHPPPAALSDGTVTYLPTPTNPPLGAAVPPFDTATIHLPDNTLLALYTDGLIETATHDISRGMARLTSTLTTTLRDAPTARPETLCARLTAAMLPSDHPIRDDAALLLARTHRLDPGDVASWPLPESPVAAGLARRHVRDQLAAWQLDDLVTTTELLVSELVGNVIRHAKGPIHLRLLRTRTLTCEVSDASLTTPIIRRAAWSDEGGRGLQLIAALAHRWGTRYTTQGKTIWTEQPIPA